MKQEVFVWYNQTVGPSASTAGRLSADWEPSWFGNIYSLGDIETAVESSMISTRCCQYEETWLAPNTIAFNPSAIQFPRIKYGCLAHQISLCRTLVVGQPIIKNTPGSICLESFCVLRRYSVQNLTSASAVQVGN
ncbi:unnamed protein product [Chondrus crispus]|uniref:Uncharacterized protein n=1 Tax=Chondrus crispus TaxID=2769 RepID=R7Q4G4_CHOCR|nr:unnamed protein product [Chondrus crispus]CDF33412.1 unnamed protein product [Chondrus crispus]|eukprot:XP_005713215.1 unnamed protein product [Chondrus crispus]